MFLGDKDVQRSRLESAQMSFRKSVWIRSVDKSFIDKRFLKKYNVVVYWLPESAPNERLKTLSVVGKNKHGIRKEVLR